MPPDPRVVQTILSVGSQMGANQMQLLSALAAGLVESGLQNLRYGDRDSQGVFQQRPSQGWGTVAQVTNPEYAARKYFDSLMKLKWQGTPGQMAQRVQRSAYPDRYDQRMSEAQQILAKFGQGMQFGAGMPEGLDLSLDLSSQLGIEPDDQQDEDEDGELLATMLQSISDRVAGRGGGPFIPSMRETNEVDERLAGDDHGIQLPDAYVPMGGPLGQAGDFPQIGPPSKAGVPKGIQPNAVRVAQLVRRMGFSGSIGGIGSRPGKSDHPSGHAIDVMTMDNIDQGWQMAHYLHANRDALGIKYLIFNGRISSSRDNWRWRPYKHYSGGNSPTLRHDDHIHVSVF